MAEVEAEVQELKQQPETSELQLLRTNERLARRDISIQEGFRELERIKMETDGWFTLQSSVTDSLMGVLATTRDPARRAEIEDQLDAVHARTRRQQRMQFPSSAGREKGVRCR